MGDKTDTPGAEESETRSHAEEDERPAESAGEAQANAPSGGEETAEPKSASPESSSPTNPPERQAPDTGGGGQGKPRTLTRKIATTIKESAGATGFARLKDYALPILTLGILIVLLLSFRTVLLPFIFACILVYLMEPIVRRMARSSHDQRGLPRWGAVILVYLVFIGVATTSSILVIPRFVTEIVRFAETVPDVVQDFREDELPGINKDVQTFIRSYFPVSPERTDFAPAQRRVKDARLDAARHALAHAHARDAVDVALSVEVDWRIEEMGEEGTLRRYVVEGPIEQRRDFGLDDSITTSGWTYGVGDAAPALRLVPDSGGGLRVYLNDVSLEVEKKDDESWLVRRESADAVPVAQQDVGIEEMFNLERRLDEIVESLVMTSNERLASLIEFAQMLVVGIVGAFVALVLTLMVAAFISIDLPRVMAFLRGLVPRDARHGYDILLHKMDRGLAGVVRGQLFICLINGVLTYIGLMILDVKFSVLLAVVAGILSLIPVFGTIISTIPIVLIALTDGFMTGVLALGWILLIHFVEANILNPKIIGSSAHIHPVIVIFALLAGESAYGLVGALLAVPTASILLTLFDFIRTKAWKEQGPQPAE